MCIRGKHWCLSIFVLLVLSLCFTFECLSFVGVFLSFFFVIVLVVYSSLLVSVTNVDFKAVFPTIFKMK